MKWPITPLRDIARQVRRSVRPRAGTLYGQVGVRLWGRGAYRRDPIDGVETKYSVLYRIQKDDIVVNKIWARNGSVTVAGTEIDGAYGSSEFPTYCMDTDILLPGWFGWYTRHPELWAQCDGLSRGTSGQNRLRPEQFLDVRLAIPPLEEQHRMVATLDNVERLIRERQRALEEAKRETEALLANVFRNLIYGVPRRPMAEIAPVVRRPIVVEANRSYRELGVRSFGRGTFHKPALDWASVGSKRLFVIRTGDLLFNSVFAWEGAVAVARPVDDGRVGSHRFLACVPDPMEASSDFLQYYFLTPDGLQQLGDASRGGAGRNRPLALSRLQAIEVPAPPMERQCWFDSLRAGVRKIDVLRSTDSHDVNGLLPAMLYRVFKEDTARQLFRRLSA